MLEAHIMPQAFNDQRSFHEAKLHFMHEVHFMTEEVISFLHSQSAYRAVRHIEHEATYRARSAYRKIPSSFALLRREQRSEGHFSGIDQTLITESDRIALIIEAAVKELPDDIGSVSLSATFVRHLPV